MGSNMSKEFYREKPLKDYKLFYGWAPYFRYGANTVTGWRKKQEDRISCCPGFYEGLSTFSIFDGHGGGEVSEYLKQNYSNHLMKALEENKDIEISLYLSFLMCDYSLQNITEEELIPIKEAVDPKFILEDASTLTSQPEFKNAVSTEIAKFLQEKSYKRGESSKSSLTNSAKSLIASSSTMQQLFLEPLKDDDDDDDDYEVEEEYMDTEENISSIESSPEDSISDDEDSAADGSEVMMVQSSEPEDELKVSAEDSKQDDSKQLEKKLCEEKDCSTNKVNMCVENTVFNNRSNENGIESETVSDACNAENASLDNTKPLVGLCTGSTAAVLVLSEEKVYAANVGDSRCVACIKGKAVDLTKDHLPTDPEEYLRIKESGHDVEDERIDGGLNMSRAFGDFGLKSTHAQDPVDAVICHPYISSMDITDDLEFIILASDGIWHELSSQDVIDFIKGREDEDPQDICTELFELLMPPDVTEDGSGLDNMSGIIIFFEKTHLRTYIERNENVRYSYVYPKEEKMGDCGASADFRDVEEYKICNMKKNNVVPSYDPGVSKAPDAFEKLMFSLADKTTYFPCQNPFPTQKTIIEIDLVSSDDEAPAWPSTKEETDQFSALPSTKEQETEDSHAAPAIKDQETDDTHTSPSTEEQETYQSPALPPIKEQKTDESYVSSSTKVPETYESPASPSTEEQEIDDSHAVPSTKDQETDESPASLSTKEESLPPMKSEDSENPKEPCFSTQED